MRNYEKRVRTIEKRLPYAMPADEIEKIKLSYVKDNPDMDIIVIPVSKNEVLVYITGRVNKPDNTGTSE